MLDVRDGDVAKLATLFQRYSARLYSYFVRRTGRRDIGEDLVQEVFFRMLKYRQTYRGDAPFTIWMYRMARNASIDFARKWKREMPMNDHIEDEPDREMLPSEEIERRQEQELLRLA